jgi:hypothetical protein
MDIKEWIDHISKPRAELGGMSVCPYAKGAKFEIIETDGNNISPPAQDFELIIYKLPDAFTIAQVEQLAEEYNKLFPNIVFLADPKDRNTEINHVKTNNGKYNLILCQLRNNLEPARVKLKNTKYYTYWSPDYLDKILNS